MQVNFRMPAELKARLEQAAKENHRSVTAELVARLESTFMQPVSDSDAEGQEKRDQLRERVWRIIDEAIDEALKQDAKPKE